MRVTVQDTGVGKDFLNLLQSFMKQKPTDEPTEPVSAQQLSEETAHRLGDKPGYLHI